MIRKPNRSDAKRLTTGVLVAGVVAAGAVALAGPAGAAATAITATPAQSNYHVGTQATINVTTTGTPTALAFRITAGPDQTAGTTGTPCAPAAATPSACTFTNNGTAGTDTVQVFDDVDGSGTYNTGEPQTTTTVVFSGNPTTLTLTPAGTGSVSVQNPKTFTVKATDTGGRNSAGSTVTLTSTETTKSATAPISYTDANGGAIATTDNNPTADANGNYAHVDTATVTTDQTGSDTFGVQSTTAGSVTVTASVGDLGTATVKSSSSTFSVTGGNNTANSVTKLVAAPATQTAGTNGTASVVVTATDTNGDPVGGVTVQYEITSGPDATATGTYPSCANTTSQVTGKTTCTVPANNNTAAGTDAFLFFVNQTVTGTQQSPGPDGTEPTASASVTFVAQPAYDSITLTTPDQSNAGNNAAATVITGTASSTFTATVEEENTAGTAEAPVANAVVNFTVSQISPNGTTVALNPVSATTDASGVAKTVATPSTTTAGTTYRVTAIVGNGSSYNGGGSNSAFATVTYAASQAQAPVVTPTIQSATIGGSATVTATVDDQFGTPKSGVSVAFSVTGRNSGQAGNLTTNANGQAAFTYTDTPTSASTTDTVTATTGAGSDSATVDWITGSTTVSNIVVALPDTYVNNNNAYYCPTSNPNASPTAQTCDIEGSNAATQYAQNGVTATVTNAGGDPLAGVTVTFSVSKGFIGTGSTTATAAVGKTTATATTNANGVATANVGSTASGAQVITASAGTPAATSNSATITYIAADATAVALTPTTAQVLAGGSQQFTAKVTDSFGNPVPNNEVDFTQDGPGALSIPFGETSSAGTVSVILTVPAGSTGSGTVSAEAFGNNTDQTATSTYTVTTPATVQSINVAVTGGATVGAKATAKATVTGSDGKPFAGETVNFKVSGATTGSGTAVSNSSGVATFSFTAAKVGTFTVKATSSSNSGATDSASGKTEVQQVTAKLTLTSTKKGQIEETATLNVKLKGVSVHFYTVSNGKRKLLGSAKTGPKGKTVFTVKGLKSGTTYKATARPVSLPNGYKGGKYAPTKSHKVK